MGSINSVETSVVFAGAGSIANPIASIASLRLNHLNNQEKTLLFF